MLQTHRRWTGPRDPPGGMPAPEPCHPGGLSGPSRPKPSTPGEQTDTGWKRKPSKSPSSWKSAKGRWTHLGKPEASLTRGRGAAPRAACLVGGAHPVLTAEAGPPGARTFLLHEPRRCPADAAEAAALCGRGVRTGGASRRRRRGGRRAGLPTRWARDADSRRDRRVHRARPLALRSDWGRLPPGEGVCELRKKLIVRRGMHEGRKGVSEHPRGSDSGPQHPRGSARGHGRAGPRAGGVDRAPPRQRPQNPLLPGPRAPGSAGRPQPGAGGRGPGAEGGQGQLRARSGPRGGACVGSGRRRKQVGPTETIIQNVPA